MAQKSIALLSALAAVTVTAPAIARNIPEPEFTPPQCQQYTSYSVRADGGCVNPSVFTELGIRDRQIQAQHQENTSIVGYGLYIERTDYGSIFITGQLHNRSTQPI